MGGGAHLVIVTHGMWGRPRNVHFLASEIRARYGEDTVVHVPSAFAGTGTYAGIEVCGALVAREAQDLAELHSVDRISFIGYSAGGLFNRFAIGLLEAAGFFERVRPQHFVTIATPHYGVRASPRRLWGRLFNSLTDLTASFVGGRTVAQLTLSDSDDGGTPLLVEMSEPQSVFVKGLARFRSLYLYANARADNTVGYASAALAPRNPYRRGTPRSYVEGYGERIVVVEPVSPRPQGDNPPHPVDGDRRQLLPASALPPHIEPHSALQVARNAVTALLVTTLRAALLTVWVPVALTALGIMRGYVALDEVRQEGARRELQSRFARELAALHDNTERHRASRAARPPTATGTGAATQDYAELIRENLWTLPFHRVDCYLPGFHTHGTIIVRTTLTGKAGAEVVRHIVDTCPFGSSRR